MNTTGFFVETHHRPRRVAFLVDVDNSPDELFDSIVAFNVAAWGGRFNPIVPISGGVISEAYWRLLRLIDPDLVYAYCNLSSETADSIFRDLAPLRVVSHGRWMAKPVTSYAVDIDHQATVLPVLAQMPSAFPTFMRKPEPSILGFEYNDVRRVSAFVRRNIGATERIHTWCRDNEVPTFTAAANDKAVMEALASNRNLATPLQVCAVAPRYFWADVKNRWHGVALTVWYGDSPWNFLDYWNGVHFSDGTLGLPRGLAELWLPTAVLQDADNYKAFIEMLRRRVHPSEHNNYLRLISYDQSDTTMRELTNRICQDFKWNLYRADPVVRTKGELPDFEARGAGGFMRSTTAYSQYGFVAGGGSPLEFDAAVYAERGPDEQWMAELMIESPSQERYAVNRKRWWKLPKKPDAAVPFVDQTEGRIGNSRRICAEVHSRQRGIILSVPDELAIFRSLIFPRQPEWLRKFTGDAAEEYLYLRISDKGRYLRGILSLFESLGNAAYVFEHAFWRNLIESLSTPRASDHTREKVRSDLLRSRVTDFQSTEGFEFAVAEIIDIAGRIQRPQGYLTFSALLERYRKFLATLSPDEQGMELSLAPEQLQDERKLSEALHAHLREMLSALTSRKLFMQGAEIRCERCLASLWYHIDDLRSAIICRGCRSEVSFPAETPWAYSLNELVGSGVRDHGVVPVIRTVYRLFKNSRECFCFLGGLEIFDDRDGSQLCELDLAWIRDGEFGVAEVKSSPKKFCAREGLVQVLAAAAPDRYLLVSSTGTNQEMEQAQSSVQSRLGTRIRVEVCDPSVFGASAHPGWNVQTLQLFP